MTGLLGALENIPSSTSLAIGKDVTGSSCPAYNVQVASNPEIESLIHDLPDPQGARLFLENLIKERPRTHQKLVKETGLLSDALALAAYSPLLATTLEQNPEY